MRKAIGYIGIVLIASVIISAFIAYFIFSYDPQTKITFDGFGRQLYESPWFIRFVFGQDRLWAGWAWFAGDMFLFWGGVGLGGALVSWGFKDKSQYG